MPAGVPAETQNYRKPEQMSKTLYQYCMENDRPELLKQWNEQRNLPLRPDTVAYSAGQSVWWHCSENHSWRSSIRTRTVQATGCPYCAQSKVLAGFNDLATKFPDVAAQWDAEKNAPLTPRDVMAYSNRKVWWRCELGHSYAALVTNRTSKHSGCPYCANRIVLPGFNDLLSRFPLVAAEWHPFMNGILKSTDVTYGSKRRVWWKCAAGHSWYARIDSRTAPRPTGCPACAKRRTSRIHGALVPMTETERNKWIFGK